MESTVYSARPAWVEIDLDAIENNISQFRKRAGHNVEIMAVVKADAYGHGSSYIAGKALEAGASSLAVAFVEEGLELRRSAIKAPILLLGYTDPRHFTTLLQYNLTPTIFSLSVAEDFSCKAVEAGKVLPVQLKVDTGMGRVGLEADTAINDIKRICRLPGLKVEGLFTHLASAEDNEDYTRMQLKLFEKVRAGCEKLNIRFSKIHAANSAAAFTTSQAYYNLIRLGLALYGYYPSPLLEGGEINLIPALTFKSRVVMVKQMAPGSAISYGGTYITKKSSLIATIPVGYADGYSRRLSNRGYILIRGEKAPVVGRICMDHLMADVTDIPGTSLNDEVVLYGRQGKEKISVEEVAGMIGTVNYELLCAIDKRVPRLYFSKGVLKAVHDFTGDLYF